MCGGAGERTKVTRSSEKGRHGHNFAPSLHPVHALRGSKFDPKLEPLRTIDDGLSFADKGERPHLHSAHQFLLKHLFTNGITEIGGNVRP